MLRLIPLLLVLLCVPAVAEAQQNIPVPLPPVEYDKPFTGKLTIVHVDRRAVTGRCHSFIEVYACAFRPNPRNCLVVMPKKGTYSDASMARLLRHEVGHCNGWAAHHPNARWKNGRQGNRPRAVRR